MAYCGFCVRPQHRPRGGIGLRHGGSGLGAVATESGNADDRWYGVIHNGCGKAVVITGATSSSFNDVSLHETTITDGAAGCARSSACRWRRVHVPSSSPVACTDLMQGKGALKEGQAVPLGLQLEGGGEASATLAVRKAAP